MTASDWVISALTAVLVGATIYYAKQTRRTVEEMRRAREIQVMPKLIPAIEKLGPVALLPRVVNMGAGSALQVRLKVALEPDGPSTDYTAPFMSPGRGVSLFLRNESGYLTELTDFEPFESFRVEGECWNALGTRLKINEEFDLRGYIRDFKAGMWARLPRTERSGEPIKLIADALVNIEALMRRKQEAD